MGAKIDIDTNNRLIIVTEAPVVPSGSAVGLQTINVEIDLYSDAKEDWKDNIGGNFRKNEFPFITAQSAGSALPGGQVEPAFFRFRNDQGWRLLPHDSDHELTLLGNLVPVDSNLPIMQSRPGSSILIFRDGSQVAQMTDTTIQTALASVQELIDVHDAHFKKRKWDKVNNKMFLYDTDGITVLHEFNTNSDLSEITPV